MRRLAFCCIWLVILAISGQILVSGAMAQEETCMLFVETGRTLTLYAHVDNTYIAVYDSSNELIWEGVLNSGQVEKIPTEPGTYRCVGNSNHPRFGFVSSGAPSSAGSLNRTADTKLETTSISVVKSADVGPLRVICVPWQGNPNLSHVTYAGRETTLQGTAKGLQAGVYYEYQWDFDDGTSTGWLPLENPYIIEAKHIYTASPEFPGGFPIGTPLEPTLTVSGGGETANDEFPIVIQDDTLDVKVNIAISEGLWNMHKQMARWTTDHSEPAKIVGPWLWVTCQTLTACGGHAVEVGTDWMSVASGGTVTEADIAANGTNAGILVGDKPWTWGSISPTGGDNINDLTTSIGLEPVGSNVDQTVAYGVIELTAASTQSDVMMYVGSDDGIRVWLNGAVVWENPVDRGANDYQELFPVTLNAGPNILMVAVYECGGAWSGFFGIDADFTAGGISYHAAPDNVSVDYGAYPDWWGDEPPPEGDHQWLAYHSQAMEAFQNQGHLVTGDSSEDPYVEDVQRGLNWILRNITSYDVSSLEQEQYGCWHDWKFAVDDADPRYDQLKDDLDASCSSEPETPLSELWQTVFAENVYTLSDSAYVYDCNPDDRWWNIWDEELGNDWHINTGTWWEGDIMRQNLNPHLWGCWEHTATASGYAEDYDNNGILDDGGNSIGLSASGDYMYTYGIALLALASSRAPGRLAAPVGIPYVDGRPYADIVQDMVDFGIWSQNEGSEGERMDPNRSGGWRYNSNYLNSDNSVTQWPVLGIFAAESPPFEARAPQWAKEKTTAWIEHSQGDPSGGFGYSGAGDWENITKTGPGLIQLSWVGISIIDPRGVNARSFIANEWDRTIDPEVNPGDSDANKGNYYAMYGVMKGARLTSTDPTTSTGQIEKFGDVDWYEDYADYLVAEQRSDGGWPDEGVPWTGTDMNTAWAILILTPTVFANPPTAVLDVQPNPADVDTVITFDGSDSYVAPSAPVGTTITTYEFDFGDGETYTETAGDAPDGAFDGMTTHTYAMHDDYSASLKVIDSQDPPQESAPVGVAVKIVPPDHPPTAVIRVDPPAWESDRVGIDFEAIADPSVELTFDGSDSYDIDSPMGDFITSWDWDMDGDGEYDDASGTSAIQLWTLPLGSLGEVFTVSLRVIDNGDQTWKPPGPMAGYEFVRLLIRPPNSPPVADAGDDQTAEQTSLTGAKVWLDGSGSHDPDGDDLTYEWTWDGGSASDVYPQIDLPLGGPVEITLVVNDGLVDSEPDTVMVTVADTTPPKLVAPASIEAEQESLAGTEIDIPVSVSDACDADVPVTSDALAVYPLGKTTVTFTATDDTGNTATVQTVIKIVDTIPPTLTPPNDVTVEQETQAGTEVVLAATAEDICDSDVTITSDAPTIFPLGATLVTFIATDDSGNFSTGTTTVTVEDTTPPVIITTDEANILLEEGIWPPNSKYHTIGLADCVVSVSDICDAGSSVADVVITSVSSDEPEDAPDDGDGSTVDDIVIVDSQTVQLRSERQGGGNGRVYTISYEVIDTSGNTVTGSIKVGVPHDQGGEPAIDDGTGAGYTVFYP